MRTSIHALSNEQLWTNTHDARARERTALRELLDYLAEVDRRKLHLDRGYDSLFTFLVKGLGYDSGSAYRRLQALKASQSVPEVKSALQNGRATLSAVATGQTLIRELEKVRPVQLQERKELFKELEGLSKRQAEQIVARRAREEKIRLPGLTEKADQVRITSPENCEVRFMASLGFEWKLKRLRELYFRKKPGASLEEILTWAIDQTLDRHDPERRHERREKRRTVKLQTPQAQVEKPQATEIQTFPQDPPFPLQIQTQYRPYLGLPKRDAALQYAGYQCEFRDPRTGKRCEARHALEIDHAIPLFRGGDSSPENLQVLCSAHHSRKGLEVVFYSDREVALSFNRAQSAPRSESNSHFGATAAPKQQDFFGTFFATQGQHSRERGSVR